MAVIHYAVIDMVPVTLAIVLCTLAMMGWLFIIVMRRCHRQCSSEPSDDMETSSTHDLIDEAKTVANKCYEHRFSFKRRSHVLVRALVPALKKGPNNRPNKPQTILMNHVVPEFYIEQLLLFCFILIALTSQVFVSNYLLIKSYGCSREPYVHCFEARTHFLEVFKEELDCTDFPSLANITAIICYDLTLNFPRAIGAAGSTLAGGAIYFGIITWTLLKLSGQRCWKKRRRGKEDHPLAKKVGITLIQVVIMLVALIIVQARVVALLYDQDTVYEDIVLLVMYNYVVIIGGVIPWSSFKELEKSETRDDSPADIRSGGIESGGIDSSGTGSTGHSAHRKEQGVCVQSDDGGSVSTCEDSTINDSRQGVAIVVVSSASVHVGNNAREIV